MGIVPQRFSQAAAVALLATVLLAGCSSSKEAETAKAECPAMSVLSDAASLQQFRDGPGRTPDDVVYDVEVLDAKLLCDGPQGGQVTAQVGLSIYVRKGPAGKGLTEVTVPYFVTVTETNTRVLSRATYNSQVEFGNGKSSGGVIENVTVTVPLEGKSPYAFEVLTGIQLTPAQFAESRKRRGR
ncbi:hypothetical protein D3874_14575 [Oleomonas cavernae]|uniref:Lipoprotein n=1 Tax=Oleomonas cavernae TaxID=2320859 RepID=A0A418WDJ8_9PROT|nr:hypothetical protein [Oleomonas cavernae]RJF88092.1 hypothetical protein D3874_14575 [Oleomonas cavernae]